jgi:hypothetical protein
MNCTPVSNSRSQFLRNRRFFSSPAKLQIFVQR